MHNRITQFGAYSMTSKVSLACQRLKTQPARENAFVFTVDIENVRDRVN